MATPANPPPGDELVTTAPPLQGPETPVVSDLTSSYIPGNIAFPYFATDRALPQTIDDAENQYGIDIYERMNVEPVLGGAERVLKIITMADGLGLRPSHPTPPRLGKTLEQQADSDKAQRMLEYGETVLQLMAELSEPIERLLWDLLDAPRLGHKLAEQTRNFITAGEFKGCYGLDSIRCKPRQNYAFILDANNRFRGVVAKIPGQSVTIWQGIIRDVSQLRNAIAPEKLLIYTPDMRDGDPRGRSWYRQCYDPWYRKQLTKPEEVKTASQFGGGMISVVAPELKSGVSVTDPVTGLPVHPMTRILESASGLKSGGVAVFPAGTQVQVHAPKADPAFFDSAFGRYDREMVQAYLLTARGVLEARHGSKADVDGAQDLMDELKVHLRGDLARMITRKVLMSLVRDSFGDDWVKYCPVATMAKASRPDFAANATAVGQFFTGTTAAGLTLAPNQVEYLLTELLGLPAAIDMPDPDEAGDEGDAPSGAGFRRGGVFPAQGWPERRQAFANAQRYRRLYGQGR